LDVLKPNKQTTIQTLLALGKGQREIARANVIDRKTIRRYASKAVPANSPRVATGSPEQNPPPRPPAHTSACEPWREFIVVFRGNSARTPSGQLPASEAT
jgi:hypothetical protein